ncbi:MAG: hypothetical protein KJP00_11490 [Bacteroidia bacterium]|nr:hypothetical protein [Bacteroidia bacterium]
MRINKVNNPHAPLVDLAYLNKKTGAIHAAYDTHHLPFENINNTIPTRSRIRSALVLYVLAEEFKTCISN